MMRTVLRFSCSTGEGTGVSMSTVKSSTRRALPMGSANTLKLELGSCARSIENTTSSAVNGVPSWKTTPRRRWKRHTVGLRASHEVASEGTSCSDLPRAVRRSNTSSFRLLLSPSFCAWGSADR